MRFAAPLLLFACTEAPPAEAPPPEAPRLPDLVLVTLDTVRADRLGAYGDPLADTPTLDGLAARGALFREATSPVPLTLPAHASVLSGRYPHRHGLRDNGGFHLDATVPLVSEALSAAGYRTGAFVGAYVLDGAWGLDRGFSTYFDDFDAQEVAQKLVWGMVERPGEEVVAEAVRWWNQQDGPRFAWVHLYDAHRPYAPPDGWQGDPYRGEVHRVDAAVRTLLDTVGDDALVIVAADHGEALWDEGELEHGMTLTRSATRVPLLVRPPGGLSGSADAPPRAVPPRPAHWVPVEGLGTDGLVLDAVPDAPVAARVVETPVSLVDLAPTLLDYAGLDCADCDGRSLRPAVEGHDLPVVPVFSETTYPSHHYGWAPAFTATDDAQVLRQDPDAQRFAPSDPWRQQPLDGDAPALADVIASRSQGWEEAPGTIDDDTRQRLVALGYVTTEAAPTAGPLPSVRARMPLLHALFLAQAHMASAPDDAATELEAVLAEDPGLLDAWYSLAQVRINQRDAEGALQALHALRSRSPQHDLARELELTVLRAQKRYDEALTVVDGVLAAEPENARWWRHKVDLYGRMERPREVLETAQQALGHAPDNPYLHYMAGLASLQLGDAEGALRQLGLAREHGADARDLPMWEGKAHQTLGQVDAAVQAYERYAAAAPGDPRPHAMAGLLLAQHGRCEAALPHLRAVLATGRTDPQLLAAYHTCGG